MQDFPGFGRSIIAFGLVGIPAAVVNSGLKYMQKKLELAFQVWKVWEVWKGCLWDRAPLTLPTTSQPPSNHLPTTSAVPPD